MNQAVDCDLLLQADDSCLIYQQKDVNFKRQIFVQRNLSECLAKYFGWFVDKKLNIHVAEDKTKCILSDTKHRLNKVGNLDIRYGEITIRVQLSGQRLGLGKQMFPAGARLLAMSRGGLSAIIARVRPECLLSGWQWQ